MSPKLKKTDRILIGLGSFNPDGLSPSSKCYFQHADGSHSSEDVSKKNLKQIYNMILQIRKFLRHVF